MRTIFVTSELTYVPRNYLDLFTEIFSLCPDHVAGLIILKADKTSVFRSATGLVAAGAPRLGLQLFRNFLTSRFDPREKLFKARGLPILRVSTMNSPEVVAWLTEKPVDLIVNARTRCIYREEVLRAPRFGCVNIHHGILPVDRGAMCDLYALSENRDAGFSIHLMNEKVDDGAILHREQVSGGGEKNYLAYLSRTGAREGKAISGLLNFFADRGEWPEKIMNRSDSILLKKAPKKISEIRALIRKGMSL
ncbi:MAG: hypothetical protein H7301_14655 [Cryobacterium sp.]|nr:hypothetical protein [Oligoflexia bacterium]